MKNIDKFRLLAKLKNRVFDCQLCKHHKYFFEETVNQDKTGITSACFTSCEFGSEFGKFEGYYRIDMITGKQIISGVCGDFEGEMAKLSQKYIYPLAEDWNDRRK